MLQREELRFAQHLAPKLQGRGGEVPDWVRFTLRRMDLWFGNIRDNEVPKRKWGNGNGQMFDDAGVVS